MSCLQFQEEEGTPFFVTKPFLNFWLKLGTVQNPLHTQCLLQSKWAYGSVQEPTCLLKRRQNHRGFFSNGRLIYITCMDNIHRGIKRKLFFLVCSIMVRKLDFYLRKYVCFNIFDRIKKYVCFNIFDLIKVGSVFEITRKTGFLKSCCLFFVFQPVKCIFLFYSPVGGILKYLYTSNSNKYVSMQKYF
eukprot:TRINITY_DN3102_c0_g1_i5.p2 TRINITY_DN3102_c0_g1~~TRINITY_DN3102_c0_g1_i5.p2  ORF type:complete len:188 (+),score=-7.04 TRINITY_DN3102_c0_g1_i5:131-694(+)